jgi:diacylglycerol kinase family enzyme
MKFIAVLNRDGGTFKTTDIDAYVPHLQAAFSRHGHQIDIRPVRGKEVGDALERAADEVGIAGIIAGGGDGTISAAAGIAWKHNIALGIIPAGTMNMFARSLGLPLDIWEVVDVLASGHIEDVDIATANGRPFVHQFSAGLHARMVRLRNKMQFSTKLGKMLASLRAVGSVILNPPSFDVEFTVDGVVHNHQASGIFVSNNQFGESSLMYASDVTGGHLGLYVADALSPTGVAKLATHILRGKMKESDSVTAMKLGEVELHFPVSRKDLKCVMDGELLNMDKDVHIKIHAGELKVLCNPGAPSAVS